MKIASASLLYLLLFPCAAMAQVTLQIDPSTPVPSSVAAGSSFSLNLQLNNQGTTGVAGYDVDIESLVYDASTSAYVPVSNAFELTGVTLTSSEFTFPNATFPTPSSPAVLAPQAGTSTQPLDIGATSLGATAGTGITPLETLALQVESSAAPGTYELEFYSIKGNGQGPADITAEDSASLDTATGPFFTNSFTVTSAPEPPAIFQLMAAALLLVPVVKWRRRLGL